METIRQLLDKKGHEVWSVHPDSTVYDAVAAMAERSVGALAVQENGRLVGIVSERDYARKVVLRDRSSHTTAVSEIMTREVVCTDPAQSVDACMALMTEKRFRHLPVVENDQLIGIISLGDLVKSIISDQRFVISQLESYIHGEAHTG